MKPPTDLQQFEMLDSKALAQKWGVTPGWIRKQVSAAEDRLPHLKLGRYVRFAWGCPELAEWLNRRYQR